LTTQKGHGDTDDLGDEYDDRIMEMDWGEEEAVSKREDSPNIFEEKSKSTLAREKSKISDIEKPKNKFADIMAKAPTQQVLMASLLLMV